MFDWIKRMFRKEPAYYPERRCQTVRDSLEQQAETITQEMTEETERTITLIREKLGERRRADRTGTH